MLPDAVPTADLNVIRKKYGTIMNSENGNGKNDQFRYFAKIKLKSIDEIFIIQISKDENDRFKTRLRNASLNGQNDELRFFWFQSVEGYQGLIDINEIEFLHLLWESSGAIYEAAEDDFLKEEIKIYFKRNNTAFNFGIDDYTIGYELATDLDGGHLLDEMFFEFTNVDGEKAFLNLNHIAAIFILDQVIEEGRNELLPENE